MHPTMKTHFVAAAFILLASAAPAQSQTPVTPSDWLPALHPSIQNTLADLKEANSQMEMNRLSRQIAEMTDAQLFIAYVRLYERLGPKDRAALLAEQTKWLKDRAKAAAEAVESEGGSLAAFESNNAELTLTEQRLAELRDRYKRTSAPARATRKKKK